MLCIFYFPNTFIYSECRKRPVDDSVSEFDSAMNNILNILMNVSKEFLQSSSVNAGGIAENDVEFAEYICESMVSLGTTNLQSLAGDSIPLYLQQVIKKK